MSNWKKFEQKAYEMQKRFSPSSQLIFDYKIKGKNSKGIRQVDFAILDRIAQFDMFIAFECKDYKRRVGANVVEAFAKKLVDISAQRGVIISSNGFTKQAIEIARVENIELMTLIDGNVSDIDITIPISCEYKRITDYCVSFKADKNFIIKGGIVNALLIYDTNQKLIGTLRDILVKKFDTFDNRIDKGMHSFYIKNVYINQKGVWCHGDFKIDYSVKGLLVRDELEVGYFRGFLNTISGKYDIDEIASQPYKLLSKQKIENSVFALNNYEHRELHLDVYIGCKLEIL